MGILLILMIMSALSWAIILVKWLQFRRVRAENRHFHSYFLRDHPLSQVFNFAQKLEASSLARMFAASYREIGTFRKAMGDSDAVPDARERLLVNLSRRLESVYNQQSELLERRLPILAVVSSSAP